MILFFMNLVMIFQLGQLGLPTITHQENIQQNFTLLGKIPPNLPNIIYGEAGTCGVEALYYVLSTYHNGNKTMYGYHENPSLLSKWVVKNYGYMDFEHKNKVYYFFSNEDLQKNKVKSLLVKQKTYFIKHFECNGGLGLTFFGRIKHFSYINNWEYRFL